MIFLPHLVRVNLGLLPDDAGVADRQTVEEVHHDDDNQKDEGCNVKKKKGFYL